jgi:hypothetical protein
MPTMGKDTLWVGISKSGFAVVLSVFVLFAVIYYKNWNISY